MGAENLRQVQIGLCSRHIGGLSTKGKNLNI